MFIAINRFRVAKGQEASFEHVWMSRERTTSGIVFEVHAADTSTEFPSVCGVGAPHDDEL
jgi:heme-degrading monooxygenase HmoA